MGDADLKGYGKKLAVYPTASNTGLFLPSFFVLSFPTRIPLNFSRPIHHGANRLHTAPTRCQTQCPPGLDIGTLNIQDGRGFGLAQAIRAVERGVFDMMLLTDTYIQSEAHSYNCLGYNVTCLMICPSSTRGAQGGIRLVTREWAVRWGIESTCYHGPNVVSCEIVTRLTRTLLVRAYLPP